MKTHIATLKMMLAEMMADDPQMVETEEAADIILDGHLAEVNMDEVGAIPLEMVEMVGYKNHDDMKEHLQTRIDAVAWLRSQ